MRVCDTTCAHNLQAVWLGDTFASSTPLFLNYFCNETPVWRQTCAGRKNQQNSAHYLSVLRNLSALASHVLPTLDQNTAAPWAYVWATDLPVVAAQYCVDLGYFESLGSAVPTSLPQQQALVGVYASVTKHSQQTLNALVLRRQDAVHMLLHLLDISLRCAYIDPSVALCNLRDAVSVLACTKSGDMRNSETLWLALVNLAGATVSRYSSLTSDGLSAALDIAFQAVHSILFFTAQSQSAVLALVYVLADIGCAPIGQLIAQLISECIPVGQTHLKLATGQLLLSIRNPSKIIPPISVESIYMLMRDISSSRVRDVWRRVASTVGDQTLALTVHPFASQKRALRNDFDGVPEDCGEVAKLARNMSIDDAILVVKLVAEPLNNNALDSGDLGLSSSAFDTIVSIACDLWQKPRLESKGVYYTVDAVLLAAGLKISAADPQESMAVALYLHKAINEHVLNSSRSSFQSYLNDSKARCVLFWILEIMFHLCLPGGPASSLLKSPSGSVDTLLRAAFLCGHFSFALFAFQTKACDASEPRTNDSNSDKGLSQATSLQYVSSLLEDEVSDAFYLAAAGSTESVSDATDALYGLSLTEIPSGSAAMLANYDDSAGHEASLCLTASDHLLGHALSRAAQHMVLPTSSVAPFRLKAFAKLNSTDSTGDQRLRALGYLFRQGCVDAATSFSLITKQQFVDGIRDDEAKVEWTHLFTASRISAEYLQNATTSPLASVSRDSPLKLLLFIPKYESGEDSSSLPDLSPNVRRLYELPMPGGVTIDIEELATTRLPDTTKAREALLYYGCAYGGLSSSIENSLFTSVLLDHAARIQFTPSGVFDPVAKLVSLMATRPTNAPQITAPALNANAVGRLAYYIPQLFAMLCGKGGGDSPVSQSAFSILVALAESSPDLVVFYAVVAKNSLPNTSSGNKYAAKLLQRLDSKQVADIEAFVSMASSVAVLPQENLRWVSLKAKSAHLKAISWYQQGRFATADEAAAAIMDPLKPALQILSESAELIPQSSAEHDFSASLPRLKLLFEQLCFSESFGRDDPQLKHGLEQIWNEIFKTLVTATTLPIGYVSTQLARFTASIPIPMLTNPTEPVYFSRISETVHVIGSKTRPKLITLHLSTKSGEVLKEKYILKGSEDLRIDESVMQTFIRLNRVTANVSLDHKSCEEEGHRRASDAVARLSVYNIVPLGMYGGLIQVIDNAPSLFQIYSQHAARRSVTEDANISSNRVDIVANESSSNSNSSSSSSSSSNTGMINQDVGIYDDQSITEPVDDQQPRLKQQTSKVPPAGFQQVYMGFAQEILRRAKVNPGLPFERWPTNVATKVYDAVSRSVPSDLLYRHLLKSAQSPSHLYLLTKSMVRSISMSSIAGYILGLGDRHLDNLLVDTRRGCLVQIDFNVCYDFGGVSHVPETVPFRMTPILSYICGSYSDQTRRTSKPAVALPFAYSRIFMNAASSGLLFCRMDRDTLVNALASRVLFQPFKEWSVVEEAHLKDHQSRSVANNADALLSPTQAPNGNVGEQDNTISVPEIIRATGICPSNAFWRFDSENSGRRSGVSPEAAQTELPYGWRIAQAAVKRVDARLDYQGSGRGLESNSVFSGRSVDVLAEEQALAVWEAATSKVRLAKMYIGWAPWI